MNSVDILKVIAGTVASFGGGAAIIIALSGWLSNLWAKRILQNEQALISVKLEEFRSELGFAKSSFDHNINLILDYYKVFHNHYRLCQRAANSDGHRQSDGSITNTKDDFDSGLEQFLKDWSEREGTIRLLLPDKALKCHEDAITAFNKFKRATLKPGHAETTRNDRQQAFQEVEKVKTEMENILRQFLRTENLLK